MKSSWRGAQCVAYRGGGGQRRLRVRAGRRGGGALLAALRRSYAVERVVRHFNLRTANLEALEPLPRGGLVTPRKCRVGWHAVFLPALQAKGEN